MDQLKSEAERLPVGHPAMYWSYRGAETPKVVLITSAPRMLSGHACVRVRGVSGAVSCDHVVPMCLDAAELARRVHSTALVSALHTHREECLGCREAVPPCNRRTD